MCLLCRFLRENLAVRRLVWMLMAGVGLLSISACAGGSSDAGAEHALSLVVSDGVAYFGTNDGQHFAVDIATGLQKWSVEAGGELHMFSTVTDSLVLYGSSDHLYALDIESGQRRLCSPPRATPTADTKQTA